MNTKSTIKSLTPPAILAFWQWTTRPRHPLYGTWKEALHNSKKSYADGSLTELVLQRTLKYMEAPLGDGLTTSDTLLLTAIAKGSCRCNSEPIRVLDFGGACGAHYFLAQHVFPELNLDWRVVETEEMVAAAKAIQSPSLSFFTSVKAAMTDFKPLLIHTSGALQCIENPVQTLHELASCEPGFLILSRLGVSETDESVITIHSHLLSDNGRGPLPSNFKNRPVSYPFQFPARRKIESAIPESYKLIFELTDPSGIFMIPGKTLTGKSYLFARAKK